MVEALQGSQQRFRVAEANGHTIDAKVYGFRTGFTQRQKDLVELLLLGTPLTEVLKVDKSRDPNEQVGEFVLKQIAKGLTHSQ